MVTVALRPVADGERGPGPGQPKPGPVAAAAASGQSREMLVAMQARIARAVDDPNTAARDLAALTKRLAEVHREIEAIDAREQQEGQSEDVGDGAFDPEAV